MKIFRTLDEVKKSVFSSVGGLTIGNFDGVHRGHQSVIRELKQNASPGALAVVTFDPHPLQALTGVPVERLFRPMDQAYFLQQVGIDYVYVIHFDNTIASLTAAEFLDQHIFSPFRPKTITVGYDFAFGKKREGDFNFLRSYCEKKICQVRRAEPFKIQEDVVSSTSIRNCLRQGDIRRANTFLGRTFFIEGQVIQGYQRGRQIGFPTANLGLQGTVIPKSGVYITTVEYNNHHYFSVTNIGNNPTFSNQQRTIETHILDFDQDIYNKIVRVYFHERLRDEKKFNSIDELKISIAHDISSAREFLSRNNLIES